MPALTKAELIQHAILKDRLNARLLQVREEMKSFPEDDLPFSVRVGDTTITVGRPQYRGGIPTVKVTRTILPPFSEEELEVWVKEELDAAAKGDPPCSS